jgi:hypothetical protein
MRTGSDSDSDNDLNKEYIHRERAHSFQAPERALYSQMYAPTSPVTQIISQTLSSSYNKETPDNEVVKMINAEIVLRNKTRNTSTTDTTSRSIIQYPNLVKPPTPDNNSIDGLSESMVSMGYESDKKSIGSTD